MTECTGSAAQHCEMPPMSKLGKHTGWGPAGANAHRSYDSASGRPGAGASYCRANAVPTKGDDPLYAVEVPRSPARGGSAPPQPRPERKSTTPSVESHKPLFALEVPRLPPCGGSAAQLESTPTHTPNGRLGGRLRLLEYRPRPEAGIELGHRAPLPHAPPTHTHTPSSYTLSFFPLRFPVTPCSTPPLPPSPPPLTLHPSHTIPPWPALYPRVSWRQVFLPGGHRGPTSTQTTSYIHSAHHSRPPPYTSLHAPSVL